MVSLDHGLGVALQQLDGGLAVEPAGQLVEQLQVAEVRTGYFTDCDALDIKSLRTLPVLCPGGGYCRYVEQQQSIGIGFGIGRYVAFVHVMRCFSFQLMYKSCFILGLFIKA